jgi:dihydrofolate reductase
MQRVIYNSAVSIDGRIADPDNSLAWLFAVDTEGVDFEPFLATIGALVMGSTTFEWMLREEGLLEHSEKWKTFYGERPTFVFSSRELPVIAGADIRFVRGEVASHLSAVRDAAGGRHVWVVGGGDLAAQFLEAGALDEVQLSIAPVLLTAGAHVFPRVLGSDRLRLTDVERRGQFAHLNYSTTGDHPLE